MNGVILLVAMILIAATAAAAFQDDINKSRTELDKIRSEIRQYEKKIKESGRKETSTLAQLDTYRKQESNLKKLLKKLQNEESRIEQSITGTSRDIEDLSGRIAFLKESYASYVRNIYTKGRTYDMELLIASTSVNQLLVRAEYMRRFTGRHRAQLGEIDSARTELDNSKARLERDLKARQSVIDEKNREKGNLAAMTKKKKRSLDAIRKDKKFYQTQIERRRSDFRKVEERIAALIAAESKDGSAVPIGKGSFAASRGKLRWPVRGGRIATKYGNQRHPVLKTVSENNGVDISIAQGTAVSAVADGAVSTIWWLPSYGNLVIVNHEGGFRTVYAHLGDVEVEEGQPISTGQSLGKSGEGIDGPMLHFEIWRGRETQDPERWLLPGGLTKR